MESEKTVLDNVSEAAETITDAAVAEAEEVKEEAMDVLSETTDAEAEAEEVIEEIAEEADAEAEEAAAAAAAVVTSRKTSSQGPRKKHKNLARGNAIAGFLFVLPFIIGFLLFLVYPLGMSVRMSLSKVSATSNGLSFS